MARHPMGDWSPRAMDQTSTCLPTTQHALPNVAVVVVGVVAFGCQPGLYPTFFFLFFFLFSFFSFLSSPLPPPSLLIRFFSFTGTQHHVAFLDVPGSRFSTAGPLENGKQSEYPRVTRAAVHDAICVRCNASTR